MMMLLALQGLLASPADARRYANCVEEAQKNSAAAIATATGWRVAGGGFLARQCLGIAYANLQRWDAAAEAFEDAAREAANAKDVRADDYWAQAGNAWLAAGQPAKARTALDAALEPNRLTGLKLGETLLDKARAMVALGDTENARVALDKALAAVPQDGLAWLLSATLARKTGDLRRAQQDIDVALRLAGGDPQVQLEAGNIAAAKGDGGGAQQAWQRVVELAPGTPLAESARKALGQFSAGQ
jgi:tetratricopeptide (TPR) repeat protein